MTVEENKQNQQVQFTLRDEGKGFLHNDQLRVFERFFRTDRSRSSQSGGSGLGLAIAKSLIEMHKGEIGVRIAQMVNREVNFGLLFPSHQKKNKVILKSGSVAAGIVNKTVKSPFVQFWQAGWCWDTSTKVKVSPTSIGAIKADDLKLIRSDVLEK